MPLPSSMVTTPSAPTCSSTSASILPISLSLAEMVATWDIWSRPCTGVEIPASSLTRAATHLSSPRLMAMGSAPAATFFMPSRTMLWASTVAVVVPSPATSLVLLAASLISWAPMFSKDSGSSTSLAMVTPSLVMTGAPHFFSTATLRPLGPRVRPTALDTIEMPFNRACWAASSLIILLAGIPLLSSFCRDEQNAR